MNKVQDAIYGVIVGDMLGVPVEFSTADERHTDPVTGPREGGPHDQPLGAWSDDTSLTLALADALGSEYSLERIARNCIAWWVEKKYTSHDWVFDIGTQTRLSLNIILKILESEDYESLELLNLEADENTNGNGSLMRILPLYFYLQDKGIEDNFESIWHVSALTHPHIRSAITCLIYLIMLDELNKPDATPASAYIEMKHRMKYFFAIHKEAAAEASHLSRLLEQDIGKTADADMRSGGYVVETIEASIWSLLNSDSYETAVLNAINLGHDTDTTGAVTGGLAGLYYGLDTIPADWVAVLPKKTEIDSICKRLNAYNS